MSDAKKDIKFSLKATVNRKKGKVLFAQVDSAFADVLLSFLTLPLGAIVKTLNKCKDIPPQFGSLTTLYNGLANLDSEHFWGGEGAKSILLHPRSSSDVERQKLKLNVTDDLTVTPFCIVSILSNLNEEKIPLSDVEEVELQIGPKEALSILEASLTSKCALTDALLSQVMTKKPKREQV
ncbi:hypothetical protein AAHA92_10975 [Salvia divinorum]|uniref:DUF674 family protein n=1 Tax=Salvia divinorum TaxID=28513 RepID=A0ABD1HWH9_SALDI